jgi:NAD(P)-dependent dehydrogenase (short-subunit alcohol dehydrogenase family)
VNELDGKVVVVTGATRGIGKASAVSFAKAGARLVIVGRSTVDSPSRAGLPGTLESVAGELGALGAEVVGVAADLSKQDDLQLVIDRTDEAFGGCDVLVNNAAVSFLGPFIDLPARRWRPVLDVNLLAPVTLIQAFLPGMLERRSGRIINVTSGAADTRQANAVPQLPYAASKAGLDAMSFGLAHQLADTGVAVNLLAPEVLTEAVTYSVQDSEVLATLRQRMVRPEPYGAAVAWLARQPASFTGRYLTNDDLIALGALLVD